MKEKMLMIIGMSLLLIVVFKGLTILENNNKNNAIQECGKDNIVMKYTNQGDRYYVCKVEK